METGLTVPLLTHLMATQVMELTQQVQLVKQVEQ